MLKVLDIMDGKNSQATGSFYSSEAAILVVDDSMVSCRIIALLLQRVGISCDIAIGGLEAISKVAEQAYDIIFMNHMMSGMSGVETARTLKAKYTANAPVIVAMTETPVWKLGDTLPPPGIEDYLAKPLDVRRITQCLLKWLPAKRMYREQSKEQPPEAKQALLMADLFLVRSLLDLFEIDAALDIIRGAKKHDYGAAMNYSLQLIEVLIGEYEHRYAILIIDALNGYFNHRQ